MTRLTLGALYAAQTDASNMRHQANQWASIAAGLRRELESLRASLDANGLPKSRELLDENRRLRAENDDLRARNRLLKEQAMANGAHLRAAINRKASDA
jgi:regulator of replication initiation timing